MKFLSQNPDIEMWSKCTCHMESPCRLCPFFLYRQDKLAQLEKERELSDSAFSEEERRKERIISDLSEQLKESEERIQVRLLRPSSLSILAAPGKSILCPDS